MRSLGRLPAAVNVPSSDVRHRLGNLGEACRLFLIFRRPIADPLGGNHVCRRLRAADQVRRTGSALRQMIARFHPRRTLALGLIATASVAISGCYPGLIFHGDWSLGVRHAAHHGCEEGCHHAGHGVGPSWAAKPYRHPKFHALPVGPVFDPHVLPAGWHDHGSNPTPAPHGSGTRGGQYGGPPGDIWIEPPAAAPRPQPPSYELPVPSPAEADSPEFADPAGWTERPGSGHPTRLSPPPPRRHYPRPVPDRRMQRHRPTWRPYR